MHLVGIGVFYPGPGVGCRALSVLAAQYDTTHDLPAPSEGLPYQSGAGLLEAPVSVSVITLTPATCRLCPWPTQPSATRAVQCRWTVLCSCSHHKHQLERVNTIVTQVSSPPPDTVADPPSHPSPITAVDEQSALFCSRNPVPGLVLCFEVYGTRSSLGAWPAATCSSLGSASLK